MQGSLANSPSNPASAACNNFSSIFPRYLISSLIISINIFARPITATARANIPATYNTLDNICPSIPPAFIKAPIADSINLQGPEAVDGTLAKTFAKELNDETILM